MTRFLKIAALALIVGLAVGGGSGVARANAPVGDSSTIYKQTLPGIAWVVSEIKGGTGTGTGWVIDKKNRLLVTNHHVIDRSKRVVVFFPEQKNGKTVAERDWYAENGKPIPAKVIASDPTKDLAILQVDRIPESAVELKLATESPEPGEVVHTVGNSGSSGALWVYSSSNVRQVYRGKEGGFDGQLVETSLPVDPGASGSPIVNGAGEVVAVTFAAGKGRLVTLSVGVPEVKGMLKTAVAKLADGDKAEVAATAEPADADEKPSTRKPTTPRGPDEIRKIRQ